MLADRVDDDVVGLAVLREVVAARVIEYLVGAEGANELDVLRVADGGYARVHVLALMRLTVHFYNHEDDIERLVGALSELGEPLRHDVGVR